MCYRGINSDRDGYNDWYHARCWIVEHQSMYSADLLGNIRILQRPLSPLERGPQNWWLINTIIISHFLQSFLLYFRRSVLKERTQFYCMLAKVMWCAGRKPEKGCGLNGKSVKWWQPHEIGCHCVAQQNNLVFLFVQDSLSEERSNLLEMHPKFWLGTN